MRFSLAPLVLAALFTFVFAMPTERVLSKRVLDFVIISNPTIAIRDIEPAVEHRLSKRGLSLQFILNGTISLKRDTSELSKRSEVYNLVVTSLPPPTKGVFSRSTDAYAGRHVTVNMPDNMVEDLQQMGVTGDLVPQYIGQFVHVKDPETGGVYQLTPVDSYPVDDIILNMDYLPA